MTGGGKPVYSAAGLGAFLLAPDAGERLSPIDGPGCLVLDLTDRREAVAESAEVRLRAQLPILPCITVALVDDVGDGPDGGREAALAEACDVRVAAGSDELEILLAGFADTPLAALAFVQLLRSTVQSGIHAGLLSESFVYSTLQAGEEFRSFLETRMRRRKGRARSEATAPQACRIERDRDRVDIRLTRSEKHNAFSRAMRDGLSEALGLVLADPSIREVVLSGEGPSFCSGGDLDEFGSFPDPAVAHAVRTTRSPALLLAQLSERVRCEVHGACIGAGIELPAFTGRVVAEEDAYFRLPEVGLGLVPGAGGTVSLPRRIGRQRTAWLGLSGARIGAQTALAWGLVDEVRLGQHVDPSEPHSESAS